MSDARRLLGPTARERGNPATLARTSLAELELAQGNSVEAIRLHEANLNTYSRFQATLSLAQIHESRGDIEQARVYYRSFLTITRAGDQDLPEIVQAKEALARLRG
ncbi:MAG: hypothetical protein O2956_14700 [Gemmatimonadetes bacterium]|nr:hypothetical protein [Gemmatimonadota bacterium]